MPALQVRDMDQELYERLGACAKKQHRSISQQTTYIIERYLHLFERGLVDTYEELPEIGGRLHTSWENDRRIIAEMRQGRRPEGYEYADMSEEAIAKRIAARKKLLAEIAADSNPDELLDGDEPSNPVRVWKDESGDYLMAGELSRDAERTIAMIRYDREHLHEPGYEEGLDALWHSFDNHKEDSE